MRSFLSHNVIKFFGILAVFAVLSACRTEKPQPLPPLDQRLNADMVYPQDPNMIRTPKGANELDLETPLRCSVNWDTQQMILTLPYNMSAFRLEKNGVNDPLPRFEVTGFSFEKMPAEKALYKLTKEAGIKLVAKDAPYASISAENLRGEFSEVINMIADAGEIYYSYEASRVTLRCMFRSRGR